MQATEQKVDTSHWAYQQGFAAGLENKTAERGLMVFGLSCAGDHATKVNTKLWLKGFDAGVIAARERASAARNAKPVNPWGHKYA